MLVYLIDFFTQQAFLKQAQEKSGLYVNLTGALGRRTRFQEFDTAQLVLEAASKSSSQLPQSSRPKEVENENEVLLPEPKYTQPVQVRLACLLPLNRFELTF